ncbi:MAG: PGPGW domain-containing protein [Acidimicrobiales bacterium]
MSPAIPGEPGPPHRSERREHLDELLEAAIEAEIETGRREETVTQAERNLVLRVLRVGLGVIVVGVGISLLVLPGPGLIVIAGGLALMAQDVPFAKRFLDKVRERIPEDEDGGIATWVVVLSVTALVVSIAGSIWFTFLR